MRSTSNEQHNGLEGLPYRELRLLEEVASTQDLSQRRLAHRLGIALGVANLLVRNLVKAGYIKATRVHWKRWAYVITPAGVARKLQLTVGYVDRFLDHYRRVRVLLSEELETREISPEARIAIYGSTDLAELVYMGLRDMGVTSIELFDQGPNGRPLLGMRVRSLESIDPSSYSHVMVAFSSDMDARCQELYELGVSAARVIPLFSEGVGEAVPKGDAGG
jgi:DNA-binding Lrp family transcriptional regulator